MKSKNEINNNDVEILIVEDSPTQAKYLRHLLEEGRYTVTTAANGKQAFVALREHKPTLIISDIVMPEMDGYELCKKIRSDENLKDIPVILLTALSDPRDVIKGLECGANNFMVKPYDEKYLISRVRNITSNIELRKDTRAEMGIKVFFAGEKYFITAERLQILDFLLGTYESAVQKNLELIKVQDELRSLNEQLEQKVEDRTAHLSDEITERKQVEKALRQSEENFKNIFQSVPESLLAVDKQIEVLKSNNAFANLISKFAPELNMSEDELKQKILSELRKQSRKTKHGIIEISAVNGRKRL
ncbi:MAG: response regulator [Candidatus Cloacimonetes bacterium]|nr:response regulator [Candidatus Cloacimonadota bacterium]